MREIYIGRGLCAIQGLVGIDCKFMFYFLQTFEEYFNKEATGTTFMAISADIIKNALFPLPPLAEQRRIVYKIDELMALCDELKVAQELSVETATIKITPSPQLTDNTADEIGIAARGDGISPFSKKLDQAIYDWEGVDE